MKYFTLRRLAVLLAVIGFGWMLPKLVTPYSDLISINNGLQFFLGTVLFVVSAKSTYRFFAEEELRFSRLLSLAITFWSASFMVGAIWAVRWGASDYDDSLSSDVTRYMTKFLILCGCLCAIGAPEFFEQNMDKNRLAKLALSFVCIVLTVLALVYGHRVQMWMFHDYAPTLN